MACHAAEPQTSWCLFLCFPSACTLLTCFLPLIFRLQGILAANIFDWGAKACVELYTNGTILDIYREVSRPNASTDQCTPLDK
jgi:hypothetical protein